MADGFSTENPNVAKVFMAGVLTSEWLKAIAAKSATVPTPEQIAEAYRKIEEVIRGHQGI